MVFLSGFLPSVFFQELRLPTNVVDEMARE